MKAKKKVTAKKKTVKRAVAKKVAKKATKKLIAKKPAMIGKVVHFYDRIGVAIVELRAPLAVGDVVTFKRGEEMHTQHIGSMQIDHAHVDKARKGDTVGVQVSVAVHQGAAVMPA